MLALVALFEDQVETLGIGDVLHHAAAEPSSELVCVAIDAPLDQRDLAELCRPFREDPHLTLVVGVAEASETGNPTGDRLTELVARPLINRYVPELASLRQPLLRRFAVRRSLLRAVSLPVGAGVRMSLLIDAVRRNGVGAVREVT